MSSDNLADLHAEMVNAWNELSLVPSPDVIVCNDSQHRETKRWKGRKFVMRRTFVQAFEDYRRFHVI